MIFIRIMGYYEFLNHLSDNPQNGQTHLNNLSANC